MSKRRSILVTSEAGLIALVVLLATGCANVPPAGAELSQTLGTQIHALESGHEAAIRDFFDAKRAAARSFMKNEWIPLFANHYLNSPKVSAVLAQTCGQQRHSDCLHAILIIAKNAEIQIQDEYRKILDPLAQTENTLLAAVQADYSDAERKDDALTALLASAAKVQAERQAVLSKLGIPERRINGALADVSDQVARLTSGATSLNSKIDDFANAMKTVRESLNGISSGGP